MNPEKFQGSTEENQTTEWDNLKFAGEQKSANEENLTEAPEGDKGQERELAQNVIDKIKNNSKVKKIFVAVALSAAMTAGIMSGTNESEVAEQQQSTFEYIDDSSSIEEDEAQRAARIFDETMANNPVLRNEMQKRIDEVELEAQKRIDEAELREQKAIIEYFVETTPYLKETGSEYNLYNIKIQRFYDGDAEPWEVDSLIDDIRRITELRRKHPEFFDASGRLIKSDNPIIPAPIIPAPDANHSISKKVQPPGLEEPTITPPQNPQSPAPPEPTTIQYSAPPEPTTIQHKNY